MRWGFLALIMAHGLIHFMGFAKAYGLSELSRLGQPISRGVGIIWLLAGVALVGTGLLLVWAPRLWWMFGLGTVLLSQAAIVTSWGDAKFGTIANVVILAGVAYGFASQGPPSLRAEYIAQVRERRAEPVSPLPVTEADLARLPEPVRRYLRVAGVIGQPRVHHVGARWRGRIRAGPDEPWMEFTAEQVNFPGEPSRFFLMSAQRSGLPVAVFHAFRRDTATMRVRLLSVVPLVNARGPELTRAETVTLLNDVCLLAPAALVDPAIRWDPIDARSARAHYTVGDNTVSAVLSFDEAGELVDFVSDDRLALSPDGVRFERQRWSTPVGEYRRFGPLRIPTRGEGRWHAPEGEFVYIELQLLALRVNSGSWIASD